MRKIKMVNYIWITTQKEMFHRYPNAPKEVDFLKQRHKHMMKFKVSIEIYENDREIEFFIFKKQIETILEEYNDIGNWSLEQLSDEIRNKLRKPYINRMLQIEISVDGVNGITKNYIL